MKKKLMSWTAVCLAAVLVLGLAACGGSDSGSGSPDASGNAADSAENSAEGSGAGQAAAETGAAPSGSAEARSGEYVIADEVLVDDENMLIRINGIEEDSIFGPVVKIYCENKTDQNLHISLDQAVVNGYSVGTLWGEDIAPGMNVNGTIEFAGLDADKGLDVIDELQLYLRAYPADDYSGENLMEDVFTVYPTGLDAGAVTYPEPVLGDNITIAENDQARFVICGAEEDPIWGYTVHAYMENNTDEMMMFSWDEVSVNGSMCDPFWAGLLAPHTAGYADISFLSSDFEENGIETVENITFTLTAGGYLDFFSDYIIEGVFTYEP